MGLGGRSCTPSVSRISLMLSAARLTLTLTRRGLSNLTSSGEEEEEEEEEEEDPWS